MKNKKLVSALLLATLVNAPVTPLVRNAHSGIGIILAAFAAAPVYAVLGVVGFSATGYLGGKKIYDGIVHKEGWSRFFNILGGAALVITGVYLLDKDQNGAPSFRVLPENAVDELGLSAEELTAYNSEIFEINAIREEVTQRLVLAGETNGALDASAAMKLAHQSWQELGLNLSPEAFSALEKVGQKMGDSLSK